jgi:hypothetical protein
MRALHTNRPAGAQWSRVFGAWLAENGFSGHDRVDHIAQAMMASHPESALSTCSRPSKA